MLTSIQQWSLYVSIRTDNFQRESRATSDPRDRKQPKQTNPHVAVLFSSILSKRTQ